MNITLRNLDRAAYRLLKARAALDGRTIGEAASEAIRHYVRRPAGTGATKSLRDLKPEAFPRGNERLSETIDRLLYGK